MKKGHGVVPMALFSPCGLFGLWASPRPKKTTAELCAGSRVHAPIFPITPIGVKPFLVLQASASCSAPDFWIQPAKYDKPFQYNDNVNILTVSYGLKTV
jgi:hypothetical protein